MLLFAFGLVAGWLITNVVQGFMNARQYWHFDGELYKDIVGWPKRCVHTLEARQKINGVEMGGCAYCPAVFVKLSDIGKVQYE